MADKEKLSPLVEEIADQLAHNSEKLVEALYWIGSEASPQGLDLNLTDALVYIARGLFAVAEAIKERKPEAPQVPVADVRPGDFRL